MNLADLGFRSRRDDDAGTASGGDQGSRIGHVEPIGDLGCAGECDLVFDDGKGLPGQRGFVDAQLGVANDPEISGNLVARLEENQIPRDQIVGGDAALVPVPDHRRLGVHQGAQALQGRLGSGLLDEADHGIDDHDAENDCRVDEFAQDGGDDGRHQQHVDQRMVELTQNPDQQARTTRGWERVGSVPLKTLVHLCCGQSAARIGLQQQHHLVHRQGVVRGVLRGDGSHDVSPGTPRRRRYG